MIIKTLFLSLCFFANSILLANDSSYSVYKNMREGDSVFIKANQLPEINSDALEKAQRIINSQAINNCASKIVNALKSDLNLNTESEVNDVILALRLHNSLDDISTRILLKTSDLVKLNTLSLMENPLTEEQEITVLKILKPKGKDINDNNKCIEDTYRSFVQNLRSESPAYLKSLKLINKLALKNKIISKDNYEVFEKLRASKLYQISLSLSEYKNKLENIGHNYPDRSVEFSSLITKESIGKFKSKMSLRESLYSRFSAGQINLLASVVKKLKKRLSSESVTIHINYVDQESEVLSLAPMEKFRFILKVLRKEISEINNGKLLDGKTVQYIDIITAGFEVGEISALEIDELASLEDLWNPKKTQAEKTMVWVKRFGGIAAIIIPPPYGFLSIMAIMLIDQQVSEAPINKDPDYNIF